MISQVAIAQVVTVYRPGVFPGERQKRDRTPEPMHQMVGFLDYFAGIATADLPIDGVEREILVSFRSHDLASDAHAPRRVQDHLVACFLNRRMAPSFQMGQGGSLPSGLGPRPCTLAPMHPAASIIHGWTAAWTPGSCFCSASNTVVEIPRRIAIAQPSAREVFGWLDNGGWYNVHFLGPCMLPVTMA
jgi:hypothetical protein